MIALLTALLLAQGTPPTAAPGAPTGVTTGSDVVDVVEKLGDPLADAPFHDAQLNLVTVKDAVVRGKPVVLTLIYFECPMLCSLVQNGVIRSLNETGLVLGKDYYGLTVSFSPKDGPKDALEKQRGYLQALKGAEKASPTDWPFLTGGPQSIKTLADSVGFKYRFDTESQQFEHPAVSVVLTPDGRISRYLYGVETAPRDMKLAIVEASGGKVGTTLDRVLLKCFRYDPATRKYNLYIWRVLRGGSMAVAFGLFGLLGFLWRREIRKGTVK
jgi:protein SCO1/2